MTIPLLRSLVLPFTATLLAAISCGQSSSPAAGGPAGSERAACYGNGTCDAGLICRSQLCVRPANNGGSAGNEAPGGESGNIDIAGDAGSGGGGAGSGAVGGDAGTGQAGNDAAGGAARGGAGGTGQGGAGAGGKGGASGSAGTLGSAGQAGGGSVTTPPSCDGLADTCGPGQNESCCTSLPVAGGTFYRTFGDGFTTSNPATVSSFRLDRFEVTAGRFRKFVAAWVAGVRPVAGAGKHAHLSGGNGLVTLAGTYEAGWDVSWASLEPATSAAWDAALSCYAATSNANQNTPIACVNRLDALAFCTWDGGFLPTEAESLYAIAGGSEQRKYAWVGTTLDCAHANVLPASGTYCVPGTGNGASNVVGSESPLGDGKYGQADLTGNLFEWVLDFYASYVTPCADCVNLTPASMSLIRGGAFAASYPVDANNFRNSTAPETRLSSAGIRCARTP